MATDRNPNDRQSARRALAMNVAADDQTLTEIPDQFLCTSTGNLVAKLQGDTDAVTLAMVVGVVYDIRVKVAVKTNTTAAGVFLYKTLSQS